MNSRPVTPALVASALCLALFAVADEPKLVYPAAPKRPVVDVYHRVKVEDPYRWLENGADPEVKRWATEQTRIARAYLNRVPGSLALRERVRAIAAFPAPELYAVREAGGTLFAMKWDPPKQQPYLVTVRSFEEPASARALVDPNTLDPSGGTAVDFYVPSPNGKLVAVSMSKGGSESGDVTVWDVATGRRLADLVPRVNGGTAGGSVAWNADSTGFHHTRYPAPGERPAADLPFFQEVWFHRLAGAARSPGAPADQYALGKEFPKIAETRLRASADGRWTLATVAIGDGGDHEHYLLAPGASWKRFAATAEEVHDIRFGVDDALYLVSLAGAPRGKVLRVPLSNPVLSAATTVVPEGDAVISAVVPATSRLYTVDLLGGPSQIRVFELSGKPLGVVPLPPATGVGQALCLSGPDDLYFSAQGFTRPPAWYRYGADGKLGVTAFATPSPVDLSGVEVLRETAISKDGTKVPMTVLLRPGTPRDRSNPALLTGYGGFGISQTPGFDPLNAVWLEQGGVFAIANLRGGGEFGDAWHEAGKLTRKQNVFDDFLACAERLVELGLTRPEKLGIVGGSNGGLLVDAALTQRPDLFRAVVSFVGIADMLRVESTPNGAFNVTEYGSVKDPAQFKAFLAYSPYHRVKDGTAYPAVLMITGENDPRVEPWHSRKFAARLQAATTSGQPILLATSSDAGHGVGSSLDQAIDRTVDMYGFLADRLGVAYRKPAPAAPQKPR